MKRIGRVSGSNIMLINITDEADDVWSGRVYDVGKYDNYFKYGDIVYFKKEDIHFIPFPKDVLPEENKFYSIKFYEILARITTKEKKVDSEVFRGFNVF